MGLTIFNQPSEFRFRDFNLDNHQTTDTLSSFFPFTCPSWLIFLELSLTSGATGHNSAYNFIFGIVLVLALETQLNWKTKIVNCPAVPPPLIPFNSHFHFDNFSYSSPLPLRIPLQNEITIHLLNCRSLISSYDTI